MGVSRMEALHRHLIRFIAIDVVLLALLLISSNSGGSASMLIFHLLLGFILIPLGLVSVVSMIKRTQWGIGLSVVILGLIGSAFLILGVLGGIGYLSGENDKILLHAVLVLLGLSTMRKTSTVRNASYILWYKGQHSSVNEAISSEQEVLATCPTCHSVLAVLPGQLSNEDRCPNCGVRLVTSEEE